MPHSAPLDESPPAAALLGRVVRAIDSDTATVQLDYEARPEFANRHGTIAGGFLAAMLDSATSAPALLALDEGKTVVTTSLHVSFERPARVGRLRASARVIERSDRELHSTSELMDPEGKIVARATATFRIIDRLPSSRGSA